MEEDCKKVKALRAAAKIAKKRKANAVSTDDDRQVSSASSATLEPVSTDTIPPTLESPATPVSQFGRSVYKKTRTNDIPLGENKSS